MDGGEVIKGKVEWREEGSRWREQWRERVWSGKRGGTVGGRKGIGAGKVERTEERHRLRKAIEGS